MRVLTVRNPWATAIIHGVEVRADSEQVDHKRVENRRQNPAGRYRGLLAIHVARARDEDWSSSWPEQAGSPVAAGTMNAQRGHVIGVVDLVDVHHDQSIRADTHCCSDGGWHGSLPCAGPCSPWARPDQHHLVLANPRPLSRQVPAVGRLGLWQPGLALHTAITRQLRRVA